MPRLDIILLPLLGGYLFLITFNLTKYYHIRIDRQKLIYNSLICAVLFAFLAYIFDYFILQNTRCIVINGVINFSLYDLRMKANYYIDEILSTRTSKELKYAILTFFLTYPTAFLLNIIIKKRFAFDFTIKKWGNQYERLFWKTLSLKSDSDKLLMITTKSNKVYIGYVNKLSEPIGDSHVTILPNLSGYRNKETLVLTITTKYTDVIEKFINENRTSEIEDKIGVIIPVSEILIVSKFDYEIFSEFNQINTFDKNDDINSTSSKSSIFELIRSLFKYIKL